MTNQQFGRKFSLTVANAAGKGIDLSQFRVRFQVRQMDLETPNNLLARVYNLSSATIQNLTQSFGQEQVGQVLLQAGYENNDAQYGTIFVGSVVFYRSGKESNVDSYLDILAVDGDIAYNFATLNVTLAAGATPQAQLGAVQGAFKQFGVTAGYTDPLPTSGLPRGKVLFGMAREVIRDLAQTNNMKWSIVNGQLVLVNLTGFLQERAVVLNSQTGLIGIPEQQPDGVHVRSLLNPNFKPSRLVQLNNADIQKYLISPSPLNLNALFLPPEATIADGAYQVMVVDHRGDTRGAEWYSDLICISTHQPIPPQLLTRIVGTSQP